MSTYTDREQLSRIRTAAEILRAAATPSPAVQTAYDIIEAAAEQLQAGGNWKLWRIDPATGERTLVGDGEDTYSGIAKQAERARREATPAATPEAAAPAPAANDPAAPWEKLIGRCRLQEIIREKQCHTVYAACREIAAVPAGVASLAAITGQTEAAISRAARGETVPAVLEAMFGAFQLSFLRDNVDAAREDCRRIIEEGSCYTVDAALALLVSKHKISAGTIAKIVDSTDNTVRKAIADGATPELIAKITAAFPELEG